MQALILAGGKGTRLRPLTVYTPKPIVPILNRPFLLYQIDILKRAGIDKIVLSLGYQPNKIEDLLGDGREHGVELTYLTEPDPMGTGGAFRYAEDKIDRTTIILNGDILTDIDISAAVAYHRERKAEATIALVRVNDPSAYGLVETDDELNVRGFLEKPNRDEIEKSGVNTINAGIYVLEPSILELIPKGHKCSFEYDVFPSVLTEKRKFSAFIIDSYWRDLGTPKSYLEAHMDFFDGKIKDLRRERTSDQEIATAANIDSISVIGEGCVIKPGARIIRSSIGPGVHIEEKAVIEDSVVWGYSRIGSSASVNGAVIGKSCYIGRNAAVKSGAVLGDKTSISDYSHI